MRTALIASVALAVAALDWAALDDITTGREPDVTLEIATVLVSVPVLAALARAWRRRRQ